MYNTTPNKLGVAFDRAWDAASVSIDEDGKDQIEKYFKERWKITLSDEILEKSESWNPYVWERVTFKSKAAFVLFMLEWS